MRGKKLSASFNSIFYKLKIKPPTLDLLIYGFLKKIPSESLSELSGGNFIESLALICSLHKKY